MRISDLSPGEAFHNIKDEKLYPSVGMKKPGEHLRINFGATPFVFDIDAMMEVRTIQLPSLLHSLTKNRTKELG